MTSSSHFAPPNWQAIAARQWPGAAINGSGQFAVLFHCTEQMQISLFDFRMAAIDAIRKPCGHAFCKMRHEGRILKEMPAEKYYRKTNSIARMMEATV